VKLYEPYHLGSPEFIPRYSRSVDVPADHYYVLGDNRNYSADSHEWGFLPKSRIIGKAAFLIFSPLNLKPEFAL
jgi:signal peptidase I